MKRTKENLLQALSDTRTHLAEHFLSLLGERPSGSQWRTEKGMTEEIFRERLDWEFNHSEDGVDFYRADISDVFPDAVCAACSVDSFPPEFFHNVRLVEGDHGPELVCPGLKTRETKEAWAIVGDDGGRRVVFTVHPGEPMASVTSQATIKLIGDEQC